MSERARCPRSNRLSSGVCICVNVDPLGGVAVAGDLGVEDEKAALEFGYGSSHLRPMMIEQPSAFRSRRGALSPQIGVTHHLADRHSGRFQATDEGNPREDRNVVIPPSRSVSICEGYQPNTLVVAQRMDR